MKQWFTACNAPSAPRTDLTLLKQLRTYHHSVGRVAEAKLEGHLEYLSPELVLLALFNDLDSPNTKRFMIQSIQKNKEHKPRKVKASLKKGTLPTLDTLTSPVSRNLLHQLHLNNSFSEEDLELWQQSEAFCNAKTTIRNLPTVNDHAERGVALIQDFNCRHTANARTSFSIFCKLLSNTEGTLQVPQRCT